MFCQIYLAQILPFQILQLQLQVRHNLDVIEVFDEKGIMLNVVPKYEGMDLYKARNEIVKDLESLGVIYSTFFIHISKYMLYSF